MFLLNPGRYVIGDPANILDDIIFKKLWGSSSKFNSLVLETPDGVIVAPSTGTNGEFITDIGKTIFTQTSHIAFVPYIAVSKLLPYSVIRLSLSLPTLLMFDFESNIVLDKILTIYC